MTSHTSKLQNYNEKVRLLEDAGFPRYISTEFTECDMKNWNDGKPDLAEHALNYALSLWSPKSFVSTAVAKRGFRRAAEMYGIDVGDIDPDEIIRNRLIKIYGETEGLEKLEQLQYLRGNVESLLFYTPFHLALEAGVPVPSTIKEVMGGLIQNVAEYAWGRKRARNVRRNGHNNGSFGEELGLFLNVGAKGIIGTAVLQSIGEGINCLQPSPVAKGAAYLAQAVGGARPSGTAANIVDSVKKASGGPAERFRKAWESPFIRSNTIAAIVSALAVGLTEGASTPAMQEYLRYVQIPFYNTVCNGTAYIKFKDAIGPDPKLSFDRMLEPVNRKVFAIRIRRAGSQGEIDEFLSGSKYSKEEACEFLWETAIRESGFATTGYGEWMRYRDKMLGRPWFDMISDTSEPVNRYNILKVSLEIDDLLTDTDFDALRRLAAREADGRSRTNSNVSEYDENAFLEEYAGNMGIQALLESLSGLNSSEY